METTIVYALDDRYAMQAGVSLVSLLENNVDVSFNIMILSDNLSSANKDRLSGLAEARDRSIAFIEVYDMEKRAGVPLVLNNWGKTVYSRLFLSELIPDSIDKIIYFDSDTLVTGSIRDLIGVLDSTAFAHCYAAGCRDATARYKRLHGFGKNETYYNTGVLLVNLKLWREREILQVMLHEIWRRNGRTIEPDQSYINCIMINKIMTLPAKYNVMPLYCNDYNTYLQLSGYSKSEAYSRDELAEATAAPVIVHFAGGEEYRPWYIGCKHRMKGQWMQYLQKTEWKDSIPSEAAPGETLSPINRWNKRIVEKAIRYRIFAKWYVRYKFGFTVKLYRKQEGIIGYGE